MLLLHYTLHLEADDASTIVVYITSRELASLAPCFYPIVYVRMWCVKKKLLS